MDAKNAKKVTRSAQRQARAEERRVRMQEKRRDKVRYDEALAWAKRRYSYYLEQITSAAHRGDNSVRVFVGTDDFSGHYDGGNLSACDIRRMAKALRQLLKQDGYTGSEELSTEITHEECWGDTYNIRMFMWISW